MDVARRQSLVFRGMSEDDLWSTDPAFAENVEDLERSPDGVWRAVPGATAVDTGWPTNANDGFDIGNVVSVVWFQPRPNQRFLVYEAVDPSQDAIARLLWVWKWGTTEGHVAIDLVRRPIGRAAPATFLQIDRWLYYFNGFEHPIRFDGRETVPVGWAGPAAPLRALGTYEGYGHADAAGWSGGGAFLHDGQRGVGETPASGDAPWTYAYGVTAENDIGQESPMSPLAWAHGENNATNGRFGVRLLLPAQAPRARVVHVWRSINLHGIDNPQNPTLYKLATFYVTGQTDYIDLHPDNELGIAYVPDAVGSIPLGVRVAEFWQGRLWVAVDGRLHYSAAQFHEVFPPGNSFPVGGSGTGEITAIKGIPGGLVVFKRSGVYLVKWDGLNSPTVDVLDSAEGTVAPRAIEYVPGLGLVFLSPSGPRVLVGSLAADQPTQIAPLRGCRRSWRRFVVGTAIENAWVVHRPEVEEVWFHVPTQGQSQPSLGFVFHYGDGTGTWSLRPRWYACSATSYAGKVWLGSDYSRSGSKGVFLLGRGSWSDSTPSSPPNPTSPYTRTAALAGGGGGGTKIGGAAVLPLYVSGTIVSPEHRFLVVGLEIRSQITGAKKAFDVQVRHGRGPTFEQTSDTHHLYDRWTEEETRDVWGVGTWGTSKFWHDYEPGFVARSVHGKLTHQFQVRLEGLEMRVAGVDLRLGKADTGPEIREPEATST